MVDKEVKALKIDLFNDEVVKGTLVTQNGQIVHPRWRRAELMEIAAQAQETEERHALPDRERLARSSA